MVALVIGEIFGQIVLVVVIGDMAALALAINTSARVRAGERNGLGRHCRNILRLRCTCACRSFLFVSFIVLRVQAEVDMLDESLNKIKLEIRDLCE